jgi:hypothetical protein
LPEESLAAELDQIGVRTAVLRELFSLRRIEREMITREQLDEYLVERFEEERDDLVNSEAVYKTLGILEPEDDLYGILLALLGESILGFYDSEEEKLYVVQDSDDITPLDALTYAHEYTHGLQQQHFDIRGTRETLKENSDASRAYQAVVEGDATLVQTVYLFTNMTGSEQQQVLEEAQSENQEAFESAPHVIQREFAFPYSEGFFFTFALFRAGGDDWDPVNQAFESIPQSTEQILHPEKYVSQEAPIQVEMPDISASLGDGWEQVDTDTFGEFFLLAYLEMDGALEEAAVAAAGWGGDTYAILGGPDDSSAVLSRVTWDSEDDAQEFFDTFQAFMAARTGEEWQVWDDDEMARVIASSGQSVLLNINGLDTLLVFAPDSHTMEAAYMALQ